MLKKITENYFKFRRFSTLGISFFSWLKNKDIKDNGIYTIRLLGKDFIFTNPYWFFFNLDEIFFDKVYDLGECKDTITIVDCGANLGLSIIFFKMKYPNSVIYAFEPDPFLFRLLSKNIKNFSLSNVHLINSAVWSSNCSLDFIQDNNLGGHISSSNNHFSLEKKIQVDAISLNDFIRNKNVYFLKMDIEGAEYEVLNSMVNSLSNIKFLFVEYHSFYQKPQVLSSILDIISNAGFKYYIKEAYPNMKFPFKDFKNCFLYDLQLNVFAYK